MNEIHIILTIYLIAINIATFFVYGIDKWKARRSKWRIPESTMHNKFKYGVPLIINLQVVLAVYIYIRFH